MTRGISRPGIPETEFVPRPARLDYGGAQWGITVRTIDGRTVTDEAFEPDDIGVGGRPFDWRAEPGTGVRFGRVTDPVFGSLAIARAVPLS